MSATDGGSATPSQPVAGGEATGLTREMVDAEVAEIVSEWLRKTEEHARCNLVQVGPCVWCKDHDERLWQGRLPGAAADDDGPDLPEHYDPDDFEALGLSPSPCPECGQPGACGYDAEGRAYVHITEDDDQ